MSDFNSIYKLIRQGKLKEAITMSIDIGHEFDNEYRKEINSLSSRYNILDRNKRQNIISSEEYNLEYGRIIKSLQDVLELYRLSDIGAVSSADTRDKTTIENPHTNKEITVVKRRKKRFYVAAGVIVLTVLLSAILYYIRNNIRQKRCIEESGLYVYLKKKGEKFSAKNIPKDSVLEIVDCKYCKKEIFHLKFKLESKFASSYDGLKFNLSESDFMDEEDNWKTVVEGWEKTYPGTNGSRFDYVLESFHSNDISFIMDLTK